MGWMMMPMMIVMMLIGVAVLAVTLLGAVWLARSMSSGHPYRSDPMHILQERYVRGEIDDEAYDRMRRTVER